jgi:HK97 gp10 family phage protein
MFAKPTGKRRLRQNPKYSRCFVCRKLEDRGDSQTDEGGKMSVEISVQGADELESWLESLPDEVAEKVREKMEDIVVEATEQARSEAPVRTGRLRASIGWSWSEGEGYRIFAEAPYAVYQEFGTRYIKAKLFMTRAYLTIMERWEELVESVSEVLRE